MEMEYVHARSLLTEASNSLYTTLVAFQKLRSYFKMVGMVPIIEVDSFVFTLEDLLKATSNYKSQE